MDQETGPEMTTKELMKSLRKELRSNVEKRKELQKRNNEILAKLKELKGE